MNIPAAVVVLFLLSASRSVCQAGVIVVHDAAEFREACVHLKAGDTVKLSPGEYGSGHDLGEIKGTAAQPMIIEAAQPEDPPKFTGGAVAIHVRGCTHLTLRGLKAQGQSGNGFNLDDGDSGSHHITLEKLDISDIGPTGNCDGIKLSGIDDFLVRGCKLAGWGGQAVDMVGCHRGLLEGCTFTGKPGFSQGAGPQTKGGSEDIVIRSCTFMGTGVAFAGAEDSAVCFNTFVDPSLWALRILQENRETGMVECGRCRFENNIVIVKKGALRAWVNIGPNTRAETFTFAGNWWFHEAPGLPRHPGLPAEETSGSYGIDPDLDPANAYTPRTAAAAKAGHTAFKLP